MRSAACGAWPGVLSLPHPPPRSEAGGDLHFASLDAMLESMRTGALSTWWGVPPAAAGAGTPAAAAAGFAVGEPVPGTAGSPEQQPPAAGGGSVDSLLQRLGWSLVMSQGPADASSLHQEAAVPYI